MEISKVCIDILTNKKYSIEQEAKLKIMVSPKSEFEIFIAEESIKYYNGANDRLRYYLQKNFTE